MCPPAADHDLLNRSFTGEAGLAFTPISAVLDLEEAGFAIGIDVIGDGRSAGSDGGVQNFLQPSMQLSQFSVGQSIGSAPWPDVRAEQSFVRIDISHAVQELLIEQRSFNGSFAAMKELGKIFHADV